MSMDFSIVFNFFDFFNQFCRFIWVDGEHILSDLDLYLF